ncbi:ThiF/moeB-like protein [Cryptosporidium canis]|uniref:Ubiquitin-like modifier-activating enzyme 5 n=1 Tax=Cryptosporidium canis TaxID=195482 RepID=A0ABQ8P6J3_9CRYT|nr:ThiF/moeB-like protein [Cryptosporidium canis]KAJ1612463.1 ThiF/moeB-like protein [Cryptosporidium canis]
MEEKSEEGLNDERYSRLMALENMGVVDDYSIVMKKTILVVGVGGVGSVVSEMLVRCGIDKLVIIDFDIVELSNMNRMFYNMRHIGMYKIDACVDSLKLINPKINIEGHKINIVQEYSEFKNVLKTKNIDLLVSCVDNYSARSIISQTCNEYNIPWFESGVSENATSGHIQLIVPGLTACYCCAPPLVTFDDDISEDKITSIITKPYPTKTSSKRSSRTCAASLSTTTSIIAGILVNNILKYFLNFGEKSNFLGYHMKDDYFPRYTIIPNSECNDKWCLIRQKEKESIILKQKMESTSCKEKSTPSDSRSEIHTGCAKFEVIESNAMESTKQFECLNSLSIAELVEKLDEISIGKNSY